MEEKINRLVEVIRAWNEELPTLYSRKKYIRLNETIQEYKRVQTVQEH